MYSHVRIRATRSQIVFKFGLNMFQSTMQMRICAHFEHEICTFKCEHFVFDPYCKWMHVYNRRQWLSLSPLQLLTVRYDPQYALRLCTEHEQTRACVLIYAAMGLYEESVDHALAVCIQVIFVCNVQKDIIMHLVCTCTLYCTNRGNQLSFEWNYTLLHYCKA